MPIEVHEQGTVAAAPDALWPLVSDPLRLPEWFTFAERVEVLEGEGVGQRRRQHGRWGSKPSEVDQRITAWEPPRRLAWCHEAERLAGKPAPRFAASTDFEIVLEPAGDGATSVTLVIPGAGERAARRGDPHVRPARRRAAPAPLARPAGRGGRPAACVVGRAQVRPGLAVE